MVKMICFDMDGTIADLYCVENWLDMLRAEIETPYEIAPPIWDMDDLRETLIQLMYDGWEIRVISWLAKDASRDYNKRVRQAKREWLKKYNFPCDKIHLVSYGATKANSVRKAADIAILVDDNAKVRRGWHLGDTIDPTDGDLLERLEKLL